MPANGVFDDGADFFLGDAACTWNAQYAVMAAHFQRLIFLSSLAVRVLVSHASRNVTIAHRNRTCNLNESFSFVRTAFSVANPEKDF